MPVDRRRVEIRREHRDPRLVAELVDEIVPDAARDCEVLIEVPSAAFAGAKLRIAPDVCGLMLEIVVKDGGAALVYWNKHLSWKDLEEAGLRRARHNHKHGHDAERIPFDSDTEEPWPLEDK